MGSGTANNIHYGTETVVDFAGSFTSNGACSLAHVTIRGTPGGVVTTKTPSDENSFDIYNDNDGKYLNYWTDVVPVILFKNTWFAGTIGLVAYYLSFWKAWMYVFGFPIFLIEFWVWKWNLNDIKYNQNAFDIGVEWIQDNYINNYEKSVEYHYMKYAGDWNGTDDSSMFVKTLIMVGV